ncbi:hypothetical protein JCM3775_000483 [Rhodotorula graminis]
MDPATLSDTISSSTALSLVHQVAHSSAPISTFASRLDALLDQANLPLRRGDIVELQGLPGSAKSSLLAHLAATALLPRTAHVRIADHVLAVPVGGNHKHVAWVDCSPRAARLDTLDRLARLVRHHLDLAIRRYRAPRGIGAPRDAELDALVDECMARLTVASPTGTVQLAATLRALPRWALSDDGDGPHDELAYVIVDGMSEFAWADQHAATSTPSSSAHAPRRPLRLVVDALAHLRATLAPVVWISQWVFRPEATLAQKSQEGLPFYAGHYPSSLWPSILPSPLPPPPPPSSSTAANPLAPRPGALLPISLALHLTLHPSPTPPLRRGTPLALLLSEQRRRVRVRERAQSAVGQSSWGTALGGVGGTEGVRVVVRRPGGTEVGSFDVEVWEREVVT